MFSCSFIFVFIFRLCSPLQVEPQWRQRYKAGQYLECNCDQGITVTSVISHGNYCLMNVIRDFMQLRIYPVPQWSLKDTEIFLVCEEFRNIDLPVRRSRSWPNSHISHPLKKLSQKENKNLHFQVDNSIKKDEYIRILNSENIFTEVIWLRRKR